MIEITTLFCGHSSRYVYTGDDLHGPGTSYCLMCVLDAERERNEKLKAENASLREWLKRAEERLQSAEGSIRATIADVRERLRQEGKAE